MRRLSKAQATMFANLCEKAGRFQNEFEQLVASWNEVITELEVLRSEVSQAQQEYYDDRSENWQEGDTGAAYASWMEQWQEEFEEMDTPENVDEVVSRLEEMDPSIES